MGFESSEVARRRLSALAASNNRVQEALTPVGFPAAELAGGDREVRPAYHREGMPTVTAAAPPAAAPAASSALVRQLDELAQDIVATPGAGGALLAAYAAQARALSMVVEAARRAGSAPLPSAVLQAAQEALATPSPLFGLSC